MYGGDFGWGHLHIDNFTMCKNPGYPRQHHLVTQNMIMGFNVGDKTQNGAPSLQNRSLANWALLLDMSLLVRTSIFIPIYKYWFPNNTRCPRWFFGENLLPSDPFRSPENDVRNSWFLKRPRIYPTPGVLIQLDWIRYSSGRPCGWQPYNDWRKGSRRDMEAPRKEIQCRLRISDGWSDQINHPYGCLDPDFFWFFHFFICFNRKLGFWWIPTPDDCL